MEVSCYVSAQLVKFGFSLDIRSVLSTPLTHCFVYVTVTTRFVCSVSVILSC